MQETYGNAATATSRPPVSQRRLHDSFILLAEVIGTIQDQIATLEAKAEEVERKNPLSESMRRNSFSILTA